MNLLTTKLWDMMNSYFTSSFPREDSAEFKQRILLLSVFYLKGMYT